MFRSDGELNLATADQIENIFSAANKLKEIAEKLSKLDITDEAIIKEIDEYLNKDVIPNSIYNCPFRR